MKTVYPLVLCALALVPIASAQAQEGAAGAAPGASTASDAPATADGGAAARKVAIEPGEIRLDGRINAMTGAGGNGFDIKAFSFTTQAGKLIEFDEPRDKSVTGGEATKVYAGDDLTRALGWSVVKLGMRVAVIGKDGGSGKPLQARAVVLSDFSSKYVAGRSVKASAPVAALVAKGRAAFEGRDFERAQKFFREAASTGAGAGDQSGASLALSWEGTTLRELGQSARAEQVLREALKIREGLGEPGSANTILSSLASIYVETGRPAEAVALMERANQNTEGDSDAIITLYKSNLARAYMANKQWASAAEVYRGLAARFKVSQEPEREVVAMLSLARASRELGKPDEAAASLKQARARIEAIEDQTKKADATASLASYLAGSGDKEGARTAFNSAIEMFGAQGDARSAASARLELAKLDAPTDNAAPAAAPTAPEPAAPAPAAPEPAAPAPAAPVQ